MRKSPEEHANDNKHKIKFGSTDASIWISKPDKNKIFRWKKLNSENVIKDLPIKLSYDYISFLKFYKRCNIPNSLFYYDSSYLYNELEVYLEEYESANATKLNTFNDEGFFSRYGFDEFANDFYNEHKDKKNIFALTDMELLHASATNGVLIISGNIREKNKKKYTTELNELFKDYKIKVGKFYDDKVTITIKLKKNILH